MAVITNDIYTKEDAKFLVKNGILPEDRIIGVALEWKQAVARIRRFEKMLQ